MERGYRAEEILSWSSAEKTVMQAIAELNREQRREDMRDALLEALSIILPKK